MSANCKIEVAGKSGSTVQIDYYPYSGGGPIDLGVHTLPYCYDCSFCGRFVITFLDTNEVCEVIQQCTTPTPTPSPTPRIFPTPTPSSTGPTPTPSATSPTPTPSSTLVPSPTPRPTDLFPTQTPEPTCIPFEVNLLNCQTCYPVALPPFRNTTTVTEGDLTFTTEYFGPPLIYESNPSYINEDQASCNGVIIPANSMILGHNPGNFEYKITFNKEVNGIRFITSSGGTNNPISNINTSYEVFDFDTNVGKPTLQICGDSCGSYTVENTYYVTYPSTPVNNGIGGGALIKVLAPTPYTAITITGSGGYGGTLFAICSNFENCTYGMDVVFVLDYTKSMGDEIDIIKTGIRDIIGEIETQSNNDYRLGLVIFDEGEISPTPLYNSNPIYSSLPSDQKYIFNERYPYPYLYITNLVRLDKLNRNQFTTYLNYLNNDLILGDGARTPECSDIALDRVINHNFSGEFRPDVHRLVIIFTDDYAGGTREDTDASVKNRINLLKNKCLEESINVLLVRPGPNLFDGLNELSLATSGVVCGDWQGYSIANSIRNICDENQGWICLRSCNSFSGLPDLGQIKTYSNFTIQGSGTGDITTFTTAARLLCNANLLPSIPSGVQTVFLSKFNSSFSYTMTFNRSVNNIVLYFIDMGTSYDPYINVEEQITVSVNKGGVISLQLDDRSCNTRISNNVIYGRSIGNTTNDAANALILVKSTIDFTTITLSGPGGLDGTIIGICDTLCNLPTPTPTPTLNLSTPTPTPTPSATGPTPTPTPTQQVLPRLGTKTLFMKFGVVGDPPAPTLAPLNIKTLFMKFRSK